MKGNRTYSIVEFGRIYRRADVSDEEVNGSSLEKVSIPSAAFDNLLHFIAENQDESVGIDQAFTVHRRRGEDFITAKNYVGVIETLDGTILEILPKIHRTSGVNTIEETRRIFLKMLRQLRHSPFISIDNAHLKSCRFPILEVFISTFLDELGALVRQGLRKHYVSAEGNEPYLKGRLLFARQLQENLMHPERFYVTYDVFDSNIPQNRLIKSTLLKLASSSRSIRNQNLIRQYQFILDEVAQSVDYSSDLSKSSSQHSRLLTGYDQIMKWVKVFLFDESFTNFHGSHLNKAILFPMERIFEDYVSSGFRKCQNEWNYNVSIQDRAHHLVQRHNDSPRFQLRPDIVLRYRDHDAITILDCKWKLINTEEVQKNYNIAQSDMYQLYAYGKKYAKQSLSKLILIYPQNEAFSRPLAPFFYEMSENRWLLLHVVPFDLDVDPVVSIKSLMNLIEN